MDGQQTRPPEYAGSYTACCEGEAPGGGGGGSTILRKNFKGAKA